MPLGIWELLIDGTNEVRQAERREDHSSNIVLLRKRLEALSVEDGKVERDKVLGEPVRTGVVGRRTLREHQGDQDFLRQCSDYLKLDRLESLVAGAYAVQTEVDAGFVIPNLPSNLSRI